MGAHYEISPREREDEQIRDYHEFDHVDETYAEYMARLSELPKAGGQTGAASSTPGTGSSENRDTKEAA